jgi:hypothetical protein
VDVDLVAPVAPRPDAFHRRDGQIGGIVIHDDDGDTGHEKLLMMRYSCLLRYHAVWAGGQAPGKTKHINQEATDRRVFLAFRDIFDDEVD